jgi:hypothetical protein
MICVTGSRDLVAAAIVIGHCNGAAQRVDRLEFTPPALISDRSAGVGPLVLSLGLARGRPTNPARDTGRGVDIVPAVDDLDLRERRNDRASFPVRRPRTRSRALCTDAEGCGDRDVAAVPLRETRSALNKVVAATR